MQSELSKEFTFLCATLLCVVSICMKHREWARESILTIQSPLSPRKIFARLSAFSEQQEQKTLKCSYFNLIVFIRFMFHILKMQMQMHASPTAHTQQPTIR